jgi:hypothetical protein
MVPGSRTDGNARASAAERARHGGMNDSADAQLDVSCIFWRYCRVDALNGAAPGYAWPVA